MTNLYLLLLVFNLLIIGCTENTEVKPLNISDELITISVEGMHCEACVKSITNVLGNLEGVAEVTVSLEDETAIITPYIESSPDSEQITEALKGIGYETGAIEL